MNDFLSNRSWSSHDDRDRRNRLDHVLSSLSISETAILPIVQTKPAGREFRPDAHNDFCSARNQLTNSIPTFFRILDVSSIRIQGKQSENSSQQELLHSEILSNIGELQEWDSNRTISRLWAWRDDRFSILLQCWLTTSKPAWETEL